MYIRTPFITDRDLWLSRKSIRPVSERSPVRSLFRSVISHSSLSFFQKKLPNRAWGVYGRRWDVSDGESIDWLSRIRTTFTTDRDLWLSRKSIRRMLCTFIALNRMYIAVALYMRCFNPFTATGYFDIPPPRWPTFLVTFFPILKEGMGLSLLDEFEVQYHVIKK